MRCFIVSFKTSDAAMRFENVAHEMSLPGRIIPVPRNITADCGMAWASPVECRQDIENMIASNNLDVGVSVEMDYRLRVK